MNKNSIKQIPNNWLSIGSISIPNSGSTENTDIYYTGIESVSINILDSKNKIKLNTNELWDTKYYDTYNTGPITSNIKFTDLNLVDGTNYLTISTESLKTRIDNSTNKTLATIPILIDKTAPCDDTGTDTCSIYFTNDASLNTTSNKVSFHDIRPEIFYNKDSFYVNIQANDKAGSGLHSQNAIKLFLLPPPTNNNPHPITTLTTDSADCSNHTNYLLPNIMFNINSNNQWAMATLRDGQYWVYVCFQDVAGNWSSTNQTTYLSNTGNNIYNIGTNTNYTNLVYLPKMFQSIRIDKNTPDSTSCHQDPCMATNLEPPPAFKLPNEENIKIAYSPIGWTASKKIKVGIRTPYDLSGIHKLYYSIGNPTNYHVTVYNNTDSFQLCQSISTEHQQSDQLVRSMVNNNPWLDFCFEMDIPNTNHDTLYIWLEDKAGNKNTNVNIARPLFLDYIAPTTPGTIKITNTTNTIFTPTLEWRKSKDNLQITNYLLCIWNQQESITSSIVSQLPRNICPNASIVSGKYDSILIEPNNSNVDTQIWGIPNHKALTYGVWNFTMTAQDITGHYSLKSNISSFIISNGTSFLNFNNREDDYKISTVYPRSGSDGTYTFQIQYFDYEEHSPTYTQIWIDSNGNQEYDSDEKYSMTDYKKWNNKKYYDGEVFLYSTYLKYLPHTKGKIQYKFVFGNSLFPSITQKSRY